MLGYRTELIRRVGGAKKGFPHLPRGIGTETTFRRFLLCLAYLRSL